jgi:hypothetical protein
LSCEFSGFGGLGASALSFQLRGFALCQLGHALAPGLARLRRNPVYARARDMQHIRSQFQLFQLVKRAKREALGTCEFRKSFGTVAATIDGVGD